MYLLHKFMYLLFYTVLLDISKLKYRLENSTLNLNIKEMNTLDYISVLIMERTKNI